MTVADPRYPIGKFLSQESYTPEEIAGNIKRIEALPLKIENAISTLTSEQLDTPYREGGWTVRQVVHHVADSHMNAYIRFKWTLSEESPVIKAYFEKLWATTPETQSDPQVSIDLLKALHTKWVILLKALSPADLKREFTHPETKQQVKLERTVAMYAWHGEHHLGHINSLKK